MLCQNCGNELESNAKFCTKCGTTVSEEAVSQMQGSMVEKSVGMPSHQNQVYGQMTQMPVMRARTSNKNVIHNAIHAIMAIVIVILIVMMNDMNSTIKEMNDAYDSLSGEYNSLYDSYEEYYNRSASEKTADAFWSWFE